MFPLKKLGKLNQILQNSQKFCYSKGNIIKQLNYENKALFGPVSKPNKSATSKLDSYVNYGDSERYWLIEYKHKTLNENESKLKIKKFKSNVTKSKKSIEISTLAESLKSIKPFKNEKHQENVSQNVLQHHSLTNTSQLNEIPFNTNQLQDMIRFPLIFNKNTSYCPSILNTLIPPKTLIGRLPSVGKILQATMPDASRNALIKWKCSKIAELGEEGFENLQKEHLRKGKLLHNALQDYLVAHKTPEIDPSIDGLWASVKIAVEQLKPETKLIETPVEHPYLKYCGIVDYVSTINSNLSVIEWKKSDKIKSNLNSTYDAPLQLCAYLGALSADERYNLTANNGFIVIAYTNGQPAQIHHLNDNTLKKYWNIWLLRLQEYWIRLRDGTIPEPI